MLYEISPPKDNTSTPMLYSYYLLTLVKILQADGGHGGDIFHIKKVYCKTTLKNLNTERYLLPDLIKKKTNRSTGPGRKEV
jgi:hypothetical protein